MPDVVIFGTMNQGGVEFPEAYTPQGQLQIPDIIQQLRCDNTAAKDILVTLDNIQLNEGFVTLIMKDTGPIIDYVDQGLLASL